MTNREILAELKMSYEYLRDIRENGCIDHCTGQMKDNIDKLDNILNDIESIYSDFYKTLDIKELEVDKLSDEFEQVYIDNDISGDYMTSDNIYFTCEDSTYYWYKDKEFINEDFIDHSEEMRLK